MGATKWLKISNSIRNKKMFIKVLWRNTKHKNYFTYNNMLSSFSLRRYKTYNVSNLKFNIPINLDSQNFMLFLKRKFGLFKITQYASKRAKEQTLTVLNQTSKTPKYNKRKPANVYKKFKILFAKKFNKLYFRAGRKILTKLFIPKKYTIQKYITKKIHNNLSKNLLLMCINYKISHILVKNSLFYSLNDAIQFITKYGCYIDGILIYDPNLYVCFPITFSILVSKYIIKYIRRKKKNILKLFKRIKFYKYRVWHRQFGKINIWFDFKDLINMYTIFFSARSLSVEFDWRLLTGVCLKNQMNWDYINKSDRIDLSCYMTRSYNWKYLT